MFPGSHKIYCMPAHSDYFNPSHPIRSVHRSDGYQSTRDREHTKIDTTTKYKRFPDQKKIRSVYIAQWEMTKI